VLAPRLIKAGVDAKERPRKAPATMHRRGLCLVKPPKALCVGRDMLAIAADDGRSGRAGHQLAPASKHRVIFSFHHQTGFAIRAVASDGKLCQPQTDHFAGFEMPAWRRRARESYHRPAEAIGCGHGVGPLSGNRDQTEIFIACSRALGFEMMLIRFQILRTRPRDC